MDCAGGDFVYNCGIRLYQSPSVVGLDRGAWQGRMGSCSSAPRNWAAVLYVSDRRPELIVKAAEKFSAKQFTEDAVDNVTLYAPCAMGQVVSARNVHSIRFPIICGSANNQLIQDNYAEILQRNGVFYVPDYLANSGGVINVAAEIGQIYDRQDVKTRVGLLSEKLRDVLEIAEKQSITPLAAANMLAEARLQ